MIFFLPLAIYLVGRGDQPYLDGMAFGLGLSIKIVPLVIVPLLFFHEKQRYKSVRFFLAVVGTLLISWSPFIFQEPLLILRKVFGYSSLYGTWGYRSS